MEIAVKEAPKRVRKTPALKAKKLGSQEANKASFAVFAIGGKQYRVHPGQSIKIEKIKGKYEAGDTLNFNNVLLVAEGDEISLGKPFIEGASISATLKKISRYKTIDVIKYKQKSRYFKKYGHRQPYFEVQIDSIQ